MSLTWDAVPIEERRAIIDRFNARVDAAQQAAEPTKAWVRKAIRREGAPHCPVRLRRVSLELVLRYGDALADLFVRVPGGVTPISAYGAVLGGQSPAVRKPLDPIQALTEAASWVDEWGTRWAHAAGTSGASPVTAPLADWDDLDEYLRERMPDPAAPGRLDGALPKLAMIGRSHYCVGDLFGPLWERYNQLRGMNAALEDVAVNPPEAPRLLDALVEYQVEHIRQWGALGQIDAIQLADEFGWQRSLFMSPASFRRMFAARYRRICDAAHEQGLAVVFHTCGNVGALIGDLIDVASTSSTLFSRRRWTWRGSRASSA